MSSTPAQRALDIAEAAASMRRFYISLGMRTATLERTIELTKAPPKPSVRTGKPPQRAKRRKPS